MSDKSVLKAYGETFAKYRYLLSNLISRDIKVKYRRSVLGLLWSLLNPVFMMIIMNAVFSTIFRNPVPNFPMYLITGQTMFGFFTESTNGSLESVVASGALMKKIYVPKYLFPLEKTLFAFVNMMFSMIAVLIVMIFSPVKASFTMLLVPVPMVLLLIFSTGLGLVLSVLYTFFRDIKHLYSVLTLAWMYLTPVFYSADILEEGAPALAAIVKWNPLTWYITYLRDVFLYARLPSAQMNLMCAVYAFGALFVGLAVFRKSQDRFILYI